MINYKDIYSEELLEEILHDLEISSHDGRRDMRVAILNAAMVYLQKKEEFETNYQAPKTAKRNLDAVIKPTELLISKLQSINNAGYYRISQELNKICEKKENPFYKIFVWRDFNKLKIYSDELIEFLDDLSLACGQISETELVHSTKKDMPIIGWFEQIFSVWKKHSDVYLTRGMHKEEKEYDTKAICILEKIMQPLDPTVTRGRLGNKLQEYRKNFQNK